MRHSRRVLFATALGVAALACNALLDLDELSPYQAAEAGTGSSSGVLEDLPDTGTDPDSSIHDGGSSSGGSEGDAGVAPCVPGETPDPRGNVFVKSGSAGDGRMNNPFGSVANAIDELVLRHGLPPDGGPGPEPDADGSVPRIPTIYVFAGSYSETRPLVVSGLPAFTIDGAWGGTLTEWTRDCSTQRRGNTVINASGSRGLTIRDVPGPSRVSNLALFTNDDGSDLSRIGLLVVGSGPLTISNAIVVAENAASGSPPANGTASEPTCLETITADCKQMPVPGTEGREGEAGSAGLFTTTGFLPGTGMNGAEGGPGQHARPGAPEQRECAIACEAPAGDPLACAAASLGAVQGPEGKCGCGGGKGGAGAGGSGGGASVAVVTSSSARVEYSILQSKNGAPGLAGGSGVDGTPGALAPAVGPVFCSPPQAGCCLSETNEEASCHLASDMPPGEACRVPPLEIPGPMRTTGSKGGRGGNGGHGAGGPSYTVVLLPGGNAEYIETNRSYGVGGASTAPAPPGGSALELRITSQ